MDAEVTRASLLSRVRDVSDDAAWREFEGKYRELILRYAISRGLQHADADDVRQIVMVNLSKALRGFHYSAERGRFRDYLGQVVRNAISRHLSRPKMAPSALDSNVLAAVSEGGESATDEAWEHEWVNHHYRQAMKAVRESFDVRSVNIFEQLLAGESVVAVAAANGTTTEAVHKSKQRIRDRMKDLIIAQIREEDEPDG